jgi:hypothetical protein
MKRSFWLARGVSGVSSLVPAAAKELIDRPAVGYSRAPPGRQIPVLVFLFLKDIRSIEGLCEELLENDSPDIRCREHISPKTRSTSTDVVARAAISP